MRGERREGLGLKNAMKLRSDEGRAWHEQRPRGRGGALVAVVSEGDGAALALPGVIGRGLRGKVSREERRACEVVGLVQRGREGSEPARRRPCCPWAATRVLELRTCAQFKPCCVVREGAAEGGS